ncbi:MAG: EAL domain-containing protein [Cyanobacteria bacterium P01_F01_bin.86]
MFSEDITGLVLIIDDTPANLEAASETLSSAGIDVAIATSGERALRQMEQLLPDLILLDVMMPGLDGYETCRRIKQNPRLRAIPIIFMTVVFDLQSKVKALESGAVDYIVKPFHELEVLARVKNHLQLYHLTQNLEHQVALRTQALQNSQQQILQREAQIRQMAYEDYLTRLPNRAFLYEWFEKNLITLQNSQSIAALLLIDLDHFKTINDALGHDVGDKILEAVAQRLKQFSDQSVLIARLGGDEFVVVLREISNSQAINGDVAKSIAHQIQAELSKAIFVEERAFSVGASIGITLFPQGDETGQDILRKADMALYQAKRLGRGEAQLYLSSLQVVATERLQIEEGLRQALGKNELELYYQPQMDASGRVRGAEVLLRWHHPEKEYSISPGQFIPVAEETGLIHSIGTWVFEETCKQILAWERAGLSYFGPIAINVSPWQFARPGFVEHLGNIIQSYNISPQTLSIELTETALLYDLQESIKNLTALKSYGLRIGIDDFGTGYSSLAYLKELPVNFLKIDKLFIQEMEIEMNRRLVAAIISIGKSMNLKIIAEGVEQTLQTERLVALGCDIFQGYLFSKPLLVEDFTRFVRNHL